MILIIISIFENIKIYTYKYTNKQPMWLSLLSCQSYNQCTSLYDVGRCLVSTI